MGPHFIVADVFQPGRVGAAVVRKPVAAPAPPTKKKEEPAPAGNVHVRIGAHAAAAPAKPAPGQAATLKKTTVAHADPAVQAAFDNMKKLLGVQ